MNLQFTYWLTPMNLLTICIPLESKDKVFMFFFITGN